MSADPGLLLDLRGWTLWQGRGAARAPLIEGLDLELRPGQWLCVAGANGSGKSSLLSFLAGPDSPVRAPTALLPQDPDDQFVAATVAAELALGRDGPVAAPAGFGLEALAGADPRLLSAGQKQRLALAVALGTGPRVLLCDEPTSLQDDLQAGWVLDHLDQWRRRTGGCLVTATCDRREALRADELLVLGGGRVQSRGPAAALLAAGAGREAFGDEAAGQFAPPAPVREAAPVALRLQGVGCRFSGGDGFAGVDLELAAGARLGLVGPNGCGKSTLLAACAGARRPDAGAVWLGSRRLYRRGAQDVRHGLAMLAPQFPEYLFSRSTVAGEIAVDPALAGHDAGAFLAGLGLPPGAAGGHPRELSSGQKRRLALALALRSRRSLLLVDEPTAGLDAAGRRLARDLLRELPPEAAVVVASHDHRFLASLGFEVRELRADGLAPARA